MAQMSYIIGWLNTNSGAVQGVSTVILVLITAFYAWATYRMMKIMKQQIVSDIFIDNAIVGSELAEEYMQEAVNKNNWENGTYYFQFTLVFFARNRSSGSGSLDKPSLVLHFQDEFDKQLEPIIKDKEWEAVNNNTSIQRVTNLGGNIYLRGGETQRIEIEYTTHSDPNLLKHIKDNYNNMEYRIKYKDNFGKHYLRKINKVVGRRELVD